MKRISRATSERVLSEINEADENKTAKGVKRVIPRHRIRRRTDRASVAATRGFLLILAVLTQPEVQAAVGAAIVKTIKFFTTKIPN